MPFRINCDYSLHLLELTEKMTSTFINVKNHHHRHNSFDEFFHPTINSSLDEELAMKKNDQQPIKAVGSLSRSSIVRIMTLLVSTLLIMTGWVLYYHHHPQYHHRQLIGNSITKDLQSTIITDLGTSVGPMIISTSSPNIPSQSSLPGSSKGASSTALVMISSGSDNNISPQERQALQDLYDSTDGPNWYYGYGGILWDFSNPIANPCKEWYGVTCSADNHVTNLNLIYNLLIGAIPSTIGQLSSLQGLYLFSNLLTGTIPETIGQLSSLRDLLLDVNLLSGTIPSTIGQLSTLQYLFLYNNRLSGTIPSTIGQLTTLTGFLDLGLNQFTGTIPATIGQLSSLKNLSLDNNQLTGTIPATIGNLSSLQILGLWSNQLTGLVPVSLCKLYLAYFWFHNNPLQCYPECFISRVQNLDAGSTPVCGNPSELPTVVPSALPTELSTDRTSSRSTEAPSVTASPTSQPFVM